MRLATHMGFADLQEELRYQHDVALSDTVLNRLMQQVGGVAEQDRKEVVAALLALPEGVAREEHALSQPAIVRPKRLYISCDGVMYPSMSHCQLKVGWRLVVSQVIRPFVFEQLRRFSVGY